MVSRGLWTVNFYARHVLPRLVNASLGAQVFDASRRRVCATLSGNVVEIGFGSGLNVPFYPPSVTRVVAIEPADLAWRLAARRVASSRVPIERAGLDGQTLPFPDRTFDAALSTYTLCTIPDVAMALVELRRVLKPVGMLHFLEHGRAPDERIRRWQRRLEPLQRLVYGGCHLTRPIDELVVAADLVIVELERFYEPGVPQLSGAMYLGAARSAS